MATRKRVKQETEETDANSNNGIVRITRSFAPTHFTLEMKNFSVISSSKIGIGKYNSSKFEVGGYKWRLCIHPNGNKEKNVSDHISLYLSIVHGGNVPALKFGWEVKATFKFFVYDHLRDDYLTIKDESEEPKCFHRMKTEYGFDNFLSLATLKDPSCGYLQKDSCVFGAEVFVQQPNGKGECLSATALSANNTFVMKLNYSTSVSKEFHCSEVFTIGNWKWNLWVYPRGQTTSKDKHLSVFLQPVSPFAGKVYAEYKLRIKDQLNNSRTLERTVQHWFKAGNGGWGFPDFISLEDLKSKLNGYIANDSVIVEVEITHISVSTNY